MSPLALVVYAAFLSALFAYVFGLLPGRDPSDDDGPGPSCEQPTLSITAPNDGELIRGREGVKLTGDACRLGENTGWIFDFDPAQNTYFASHHGSPAPTITDDGQWRFNDTPVGDPGDTDKEYQIVVVLASPACSSALAALPLDDGDLFAEALPATCFIADEVTIVVTY